MATAWLLGAGFSKAISSEMPTMPQLGTAICQRLLTEPRLEALLSSAETRAIRSGTIPLGDVEVWLTSLAAPQPFLPESENLARAALSVGLAGIVADEVTACQGRACVAAMPGWLSQLLTLWHYGQDAVLTLNYDTLIEAGMGQTILRGPGFAGQRAMPSHALRSFPRMIPTDGGRWGGDDPPPTFELLKLHGSTNWFVLADGAEVCRADELLPGWQPDLPRPPHHIAAALRGASPAVLIPTADKGSSYRRPVFANIWQAARSRLTTASELVVFGYSLPHSDSSMRALLSQSLAPDVPITVIDPAAAGVRQRLRELGLRAEGENLTVETAEFDKAILRWAKERAELVDWTALDDAVLPLYVSARDAFGNEFPVVKARKTSTGSSRLTIADQPNPTQLVQNSQLPIRSTPTQSGWRVFSADGRELVVAEVHPRPTASTIGTNVVVNIVGEPRPTTNAAS